MVPASPPPRSHRPELRRPEPPPEFPKPDLPPPVAEEPPRKRPREDVIRVMAELGKIDAEIAKTKVNCQAKVDEACLHGFISHEIWAWAHRHDSMPRRLEVIVPAQEEDLAKLFADEPKLPTRCTAGVSTAAKGGQPTKEEATALICGLRLFFKELAAFAEDKPSEFKIVIEKARRSHELRHYDEGHDIVGAICAARRDLAAADAELADERRIGRVSGYVDAGRMRRAGEDKVRAQDDIAEAERAFRERTGKRFRPADWTCGE